MIPEADLVQAENGLVPEGEGWFVLNAREAQWWKNDENGTSVVFEGDVKFPQLGINLNVLQPGQPLCRYHAENQQEDFLVLAGEGVAILEGEERPVRAWDFVHCPPHTGHVIAATGTAPLVLVAVGARLENEELLYPVNEAAARYDASVAVETTNPREAYADYSKAVTAPAPDLPG
jgi:uncharacterized cupin superfamily protein